MSRRSKLMSNPTDPVRDYEQALAKLADAERYVEGLVRSLEGVLGRLRLWKQVVVLGHEGRFSEDMRKSERRSEINARDCASTPTMTSTAMNPMIRVRATVSHRRSASPLTPCACPAWDLCPSCSRHSRTRRERRTPAPHRAAVTSPRARRSRSAHRR